MITEEEKAMSLLYPQITRIRDVSVRVARFVIRQAQQDNVDRLHHLGELSNDELDLFIINNMYNPHAESDNLAVEVDELVNDLKRPQAGRL